jgi:hypothetical protein
MKKLTLMPVLLAFALLLTNSACACVHEASDQDDHDYLHAHAHAHAHAHNHSPAQAHEPAHAPATGHAGEHADKHTQDHKCASQDCPNCQSSCASSETVAGLTLAQARTVGAKFLLDVDADAVDWFEVALQVKPPPQTQQISFVPIQYQALPATPVHKKDRLLE